ncbi:MAG: hypothetical protein ACK2VA_06500 [Anaerolineae bacterium]
MSIIDTIRALLDQLGAFLRGETGPSAQQAETYLDELFGRFPFTERAQSWLRQEIRVRIDDLHSTSGGGGWYADQRLVRLHTAQYEAAIHELAHALWHTWRQDRAHRDAFVAAVQRLAEDEDPQWARLHALARDYVHGIPTQPGFEQGMLLPEAQWGSGGGPRGEWNDWEMYAGLASGCMADVRLLPAYVREYYADLFRELPPDAPPPEVEAPHG